jgi:hypothetical protein
MRSLWLIVPAFRRYSVTAVSFPQLRRSLEALEGWDIAGHCVIIGDDRNINLAREHGFHTVRQVNQPLARKWNDGYQYAAQHGADYFVPCGTDDWLDPAYLAQLPGDNEVRASRWATSIREDGRKALQFFVDYEGGDGIRIIPRKLLEPCRFRPAEEHRQRAIDTSVWRTLRRTTRFQFVYSTDPLNIVQFQSETPQLNTYAALRKRFKHHELDDPFALLRTRYPDDLVTLAEGMYSR